MPMKGFYYKNKITKLIFKLTYSKLYTYLDICVILCNTILLCLPHLVLNQDTSLSRPLAQQAGCRSASPKCSSSGRASACSRTAASAA